MNLGDRIKKLISEWGIKWPERMSFRAEKQLLTGPIFEAFVAIFQQHYGTAIRTETRETLRLVLKHLRSKHSIDRCIYGPLDYVWRNHAYLDRHYRKDIHPEKSILCLRLLQDVIFGLDLMSKLEGIDTSVLAAATIRYYNQYRNFVITFIPIPSNQEVPPAIEMSFRNLGLLSLHTGAEFSPY